MKLREVAEKVRSKNAGPFWLTIDIFCGSAEAFAQVKGLETDRVSQLFQREAKRFELPDLHVIKFSIPRPAIQGTREDRDMHGASFAEILADLDI
ncbi:MAG: DUF4387 family protein [Pseudomonadota bacterium]